MYLGNFRYLAGLPRSVENHLFVSQRNPQASQTDQNRPTLRVGDDAYRTFALGRFNPGSYLQHLHTASELLNS